LQIFSAQKKTKWSLAYQQIEKKKIIRCVTVEEIG
jgi:hypothetical protein